MGPSRKWCASNCPSTYPANSLSDSTISCTQRRLSCTPLAGLVRVPLLCSSWVKPIRATSTVCSARCKRYSRLIETTRKAEGPVKHDPSLAPLFVMNNLMEFDLKELSEQSDFVIKKGSVKDHEQRNST